jgi:SAM-dependent methyltransferase
MENTNEYIQNRSSSRDWLILNEYQLMTSEFIKYFADLDTDILVLDAGCGDGFFLEILRNLGFKSIYGVDTVAPLIGIARKKGLQVVEGSIYDLRVQSKLDVILLCNALEYVENPGMAIARTYDALKEDGILYLIVTVYDSDYGKSRRWFRRHKIADVNGDRDRDTNQRIFSINSLLWLLDSHQFKIEHTFKQPDSGSSKGYARYFNKGEQSELISVVARKRKSTKPAAINSSSTSSEEKSELEKTDAPFFRTQGAEDEQLTEETILERE